jgi:hypothetical protein
MNRRLVFIIAGVTDAVLGGLALCAYFGLIPVGPEALGLPRWAMGVIGAVLFFSGLAVLAFQLSRTDHPQ